MSSIKFNHLTREIEMKGSESFIESNFDQIQDLLVESFGVKREDDIKKNKGTSGTNIKCKNERISGRC